MGKYTELIEDHLNARITRNKVASDLLGTLKGEVDTFLKDNEADADAVVETVTKKMVKGLETVGGEQSQIEIELLQIYLPETLTEDQVKDILDSLDLGSLSNVGLKMKAAMGVIGGRADGALVKKVVFKHYN